MAAKAVGILIAAALISISAANTASADEDGVWHSGEYAIWQHDQFNGYIWDTSSVGHTGYTCNQCYFVNSNLKLNDQASSSANAHNQRIWAFEHEWCEGATVTHLPYGQNSGGVGYAYSNLGWANDKFSSHYNNWYC